MMDYKQTTAYLYNQMPMFEKHGAAGYKAGLENTLALDEHFGHPHTHYATIHVAGTNGKGSTSHTLAAILQHHGYRTGLYTSPHLADFSERIRVNGQPIDKDYVCRFVAEEKDFFEPLHPSFFEVTTALAFKYFADMKVDVAVIEVGLGGRIDCTNIITPLLSVITNISFDHTQFLGNTLAQIAGEKAGIIKPGVPVVVGEYCDETRPVFEAKARQEGAPLVFAQDRPEVIAAVHRPGGGFDYTTRSWGRLCGELTGNYQQRNTNTVLTAADALRERLALTADDVRRGLSDVVETTGLTGRWQTVGHDPLVICDTGHNTGGWQWLGPQVAAVKCKTRRIVFGMVADKDIDGVLALLPRDARYYFTRPDNHRAMSETAMQREAARFGLEGDAYPTVKQAFEAALKASDKEDFIFVGGSSYVVADFLTTCR